MLSLFPYKIFTPVKVFSLQINHSSIFYAQNFSRTVAIVFFRNGMLIVKDLWTFLNNCSFRLGNSGSFVAPKIRTG